MIEPSIAVWDSILTKLKRELPSASFQTWFTDVHPVGLEGDSMAIVVPDSFTKGGIERRFRHRIEELASASWDRPITLAIRVEDPESIQAPAPRPSTEEVKVRLHDTLPLNPDYTLETFVRGKNSHLAHAASEAVSKKPGTAYNPLFIYGNVGLGKTHLLQAIGNHVAQNEPHKIIVYTTSERFAIDLINAIRTNSTAAFREKYRPIDLLLIDDVQFLEGKEATQEELFHTFNELHGNERQIVLSSDRPPEDLSGLQERLVSRFRWGLVADIQPPDLETRIAILREKALARGLEVDDDILELIAKRISSNVRALEGALTKALAYAELQGERLTPMSLEGMLPKEGRRPRLTIGHIKDEIATRSQLKVSDLEGSSRKKEIVQARHAAIFLAREMTDHSFPAIGREFGNRDHSTIMHSYMKIKSLLDDTPLLQAEISDVRESLASRYAGLH